MSKGKFSKVLSVVLSASLLFGGLPLLGESKASAEDGEISSLTVKTTEEAVVPVYDSGTGISLKVTDQKAFSNFSWSLTSNAKSIFMYKVNTGYTATYSVNGSPPTNFVGNGINSMYRGNMVFPGQTNTALIEWKSSTDSSDTGSFIVNLNSPKTKGYKLGGNAASLGDIVDLKSSGLWVLIDDNLLISKNYINAYINGPSSREKMNFDLSSTDINSLGYRVGLINNKVIETPEDYPFVTKTWDVHYGEDQAFAYSYNSTVGVVDVKDYDKYRGMLADSGTNGYEPTKSFGMISPKAPEDLDVSITTNKGLGLVYTGQSAGSSAKPNYQLNYNDSFSQLPYRTIAVVKEGTQFTGAGTTASPLVIADKLAAPINLTTNVVNKNILVVSFNPVAGADKYTIVINGEVAHTSAKDTSKMFYDMAPNTTYVVEVYASKDGVDGARATSTSTTPEAEIKLEAPGTPSVVSSEEGNVKISWNATSGALLYKVFRNGVEVGSVSSPTYTDKNAVEDEAYLYTVKAFDGAKTSEASPFVLVTVTAKNEVPKAPSNPTNFRVVSDEHSVTALWDAATGADEYQVVINGSEVYKGPNLSYTYTDLPVKTEYRVEIAALNAHGKSGTQLMTIWTKDPLKLPAAKNPRAETTHNEASISWDAVDGATNYWVKINNNFMYEGTDTFFTAKGLGSDRPYTVYIYAEANSPTGKIEGEPATLSIVTKKEPILLGKPANLVASPKATYIKLTWNAVAGATEYIVKQGQSIVYQGPLTTFTDVDLESGSTYDYSVVASNGAVKSEEATVSATTVINPLPYPVNLRITNLEYNKVRIDWDAVEGADEYQVTRNGMVVGIPLQPWWSDDANSIEPGNTYIYKVAALKGSVLGKEAIKTVEVPIEPIQGQAPSGNLLIKANRVQHDKVGLSWNTVTGATYYDVYQDNENRVYHGQLNTITDPNVGPSEQHTYKVVAGNEWGTLDSNVIDITTPAAPQSIVITPSEPMEGTITFNYKVIEGSVMYVERNPQTKATPRGDGSYQVTYFNSATGETRDEGIMTPVNGMLKFTETGVDPNKNYHYDITAVVVKPDGTEEVVAKEEVSVTTPADGSGVTVPGTIVDPTNPGNGGGTTPPTPTTPPTTGGGNTGGSTGGSTTGGTTTQPTVEDKDSVPGVPGTVVVPGTDDGEITVPTEPETNFSDISGNFAEAAIKKLTAAGILKGYADGTFGPSKKITRAEFAIMAKRAMNYESSGTYVQEFTDFNETAWYAEELLTALDASVTKGFSDGTYRPNVFIPREQAAVMIANILENNNLDINFSEKIFSDDKDIIDWAKTPVYLLKTHKIVEGQYNHFYPKREITRAEAAVMIDRMLSILNK